LAWRGYSIKKNKNCARRLRLCGPFALALPPLPGSADGQRRRAALTGSAGGQRRRAAQAGSAGGQRTITMHYA